MGEDRKDDNIESGQGNNISRSPDISNNLLSRVDELIALALGEPKNNKVNFKILQSILYILSRQLKVLNQKVAIVEPTHFQSISIKETGIAPKKIDYIDTIGDEIKENYIGKDTEDGKDRQVEEMNEPIKSASGINLSTEADSAVVIAENIKKPIEVVTLDQFSALQKYVEELQMKAHPIPLPSWPENEKLKSDVVKGKASLTDAMQAMNISSRVQAAEKAVDKLVGLITYLAANGTIPADIGNRALMIKSGLMRNETESVLEGPELSTSPSPVSEYDAQRPPKKDILETDYVTPEQLEHAIRIHRDDLMKNLNYSSTNTAAISKDAMTIAKHTAENMDQFLVLSGRINSLQNFVNDHTHVLKSFTESQDTQLQAIKEQMAQLMAEVNNGIEQVATYKNYNQDVAIQDLKETMTDIIASYDEVTHKENQLFYNQDTLTERLWRLHDQIQIVCSVKADREEVQDGLKDKADLSRLTDMLTCERFKEYIADLDVKLSKCHEKFDKQDAVWRQILQDLSKATKRKALNEEVIKIRDQILEDLQTILEKIQRLEKFLQDPKALLLARKLEKNARCGLCRERARIDPKHVTSLAGLCKIQLPAMSQKTVSINNEETPCLRTYRKVEENHYRTHACHRWVGGSHTTVLRNGSNYEKVEEITAEGPLKTYYGVGTDGKAYRMQKKMDPCKECNLNAGGDTSKRAGSVVRDCVGEEPCIDFPQETYSTRSHV